VVVGVAAVSRRNATLRTTLNAEAARNREARRLRVSGVRGAITELLGDECGTLIDATGPASVGPGETVTTVRPLDSSGSPIRRSSQILPDQGVDAGGAAVFPGTRRSSTGDAPFLLQAVPETVLTGQTTETVFFGYGLRQDDEIRAVLSSDPATPDALVTLSGFEWVANPEAEGGSEGTTAIRADVAVDSGDVDGRPIFYEVVR
jgi:hypothetical protein